MRLSLPIVLALLACAVAPALAGRAGYWPFADALHRHVRETAAVRGVEALPTLWFDGQLVDHFDALNNQTWSQKFHVNNKYWDGTATSPVFFYFNGEAPLRSSAIEGGELARLAEKYKGLIVTHEHRYYGNSIPVPDFTTPNMRFLSAQQGLADAAYFQDWFGVQYNCSTNPWVIVGGSYSGALSAWYRIKYPHKVVLAYSSSGVVDAIKDYTGYWDVVKADTLPYAGCTDAVTQMTATIKGMLAQGAPGRLALQQKFGICENVTESNLDLFWWQISGTLEGSAQYGYIQPACEAITSNPGGPLDGYAAWNVYFNQMFSNQTGCFSIGIDSMMKTTLDIVGGRPFAPGDRSWYWQVCSEFGYFKNPVNTGWFSATIDYPWHLQLCQRLFGIPIAPTPWSNSYYGGAKPAGTRIVYVAGSVDPWHPCCVLKQQSPTQPAVFIQGTSHCQDLYGPRPNELPALTAARVRIETFIDSWLSAPACSAGQQLTLDETTGVQLCSPCPKGQYGSAAGVCSPCAAGTYSDAEGATSCTSCGGLTTSSAGASSCSGGALARGLVAGLACAGALLVVGATWWLIRRQRRGRGGDSGRALQDVSGGASGTRSYQTLA